MSLSGMLDTGDLSIVSEQPVISTSEVRMRRIMNRLKKENRGLLSIVIRFGRLAH